jgi:hypothetical protein
MASRVEEQTDSIEYVSAKLAAILAHNQELDFGALRGLALLNSDIPNKSIYLELIILSFVKYLKLSSSFNLEIKQNTASYRIFNSMNLNDDTINSHFILFISVIAPDIIRVMCSTASALASQMASQGADDLTYRRMMRVQSNINKLLKNDNGADQVRFEAVADDSVITKTVRKKNNGVNLLSIFAEPIIHKERKRRKSIGAKTIRSSESGRSVRHVINNNTLRMNELSLSNETRPIAESAIDTSRRIYQNRRSNYSESINEMALNDPLPSKIDINKANAGAASVYLDDDDSVDLN